MPTITPVRVVDIASMGFSDPGVAAAATLAMPKSRTLARSPPGASGSATIITLSGLRSRWMMFFVWAAASAAAI